MNYLKYSAIALAAAGLMASCDDDNDDNPVLHSATEFVLNTPSYVNTLVDLSLSDSLLLIWNQPNWGFPMSVNYTVEVSKTGEFTNSYAAAQADETGGTVADYYEMDITNSCRQNVAGAQLCRAIAALSGWAGEADVPAEQDVYLRVKATPYAVTPVAQKQIASNVVKLSTRPFYVALTDADPELWYLIGACVGDGAWTNTPEGLGVSTFPMSIVSGASCDRNTGKGTLVFNGYITTDGFKIVRQLGDWNDQWGMVDGEFDFQNGGSGNITVESNGYYKITLDNVNNVLTMAPYEGTPAVYETVAMAGAFNSWAHTPMTPFSTVGCMAGHNHLWSYTLETSEDTELKFTIGNWDTNWGGNEFPYGVGVSGGDNIKVPAGKWLVTFNDIDGAYQFTAID